MPSTTEVTIAGETHETYWDPEVKRVPHYSRDEGPIFFYGGAFSNFAISPIHAFVPYPMVDAGEHPGLIEHRTAEHRFQAMKAKTLEQYLWVNENPSPYEAKKRGRRVDLREDWEQIKGAVMYGTLVYKFRDEGYRRTLLATGTRPIAEDSPTDAVWGIRDRDGGFTGQNLLGVALMAVRAYYRTEFDECDRLYQILSPDTPPKEIFT